MITFYSTSKIHCLQSQSAPFDRLAAALKPLEALYLQTPLGTDQTSLYDPVHLHASSIDKTDLIPGFNQPEKSKKRKLSEPENKTSKQWPLKKRWKPVAEHVEEVVRNYKNVAAFDYSTTNHSYIRNTKRKIRQNLNYFTSNLWEQRKTLSQTKSQEWVNEVLNAREEALKKIQASKRGHNTKVEIGSKEVLNRITTVCGADFWKSRTVSNLRPHAY